MIYEIYCPNSDQVVALFITVATLDFVINIEIAA